MTAPPIDTPQAWAAFVADLPRLLDQLLEGPVYGQDERPPDDERGIYLFSDGDRHLYVGRTSVTARSRRAGNTEGRNFAARYGEHTNDGSPPGSAAFAVRLAIEASRAEGLEDPSPATEWWAARKKPPAERTAAEQSMLDYFAAAKARMRAMQVGVMPLDDDERGVRSTLVELYVHTHLNTPYNDFSTS